MVIWQFETVKNILDSIFNPGGPPLLAPVKDAVQKYGFLAAGVSIIGLFILLLKGGWQAYAISVITVILIGMITIHNRTYVGYQTLADRAWFYLFLLMSVLAGFGIAEIRRFLSKLLERKNAWNVITRLPSVAAIAFIIFLLLGSVDRHKKEMYYRLMDDQIASDFAWIDSNIPARNAIVKTDLAFAYLALTRGNVYTTEAYPFVNEYGREALWYLYSQDGPADNKEWFRTRALFLVYAPHWSNGGSYLDSPRPGIFIESKVGK